MNKTDGNKQLKGCPLCSGKAHIFTAPNGFYGIECLKVGCVIMPASYERSIEKLVRDWNRLQPS